MFKSGILYSKRSGFFAYWQALREKLLGHKNRIVNEVCDTMSQEQIKYKQISAKVVGSNVVVFRLEDETLVKVHVDMARVGVAVDRKNPDGTPIYRFDLAQRLEVQTKDKTFFAPAPPVPTKSTDNKKGDQAYTT
jgi:hypothetical protein